MLVACAVLERTSSFELDESSETSAPRLNQIQNFLLVICPVTTSDMSRDNHSPGPVIREVWP